MAIKNVERGQNRPAVPGAVLWSPHDTALLARLPAAFAVAWFIPERRWDDIAARLARRRMARKHDRTEDDAGWLRSLGVDRLAHLPPEAIVQGRIAKASVRQLQFLRCHHPLGWRPRLRLVGREHVDAALERGRGAILWVAPFVFASLVTKMTCHEAGLPVSHLSLYSHGSSRSRLGIRLLNPVQRRAEDRFLAERVVIGPGPSRGPVMRRLAQRLDENRIVSITVGAQASHTTMAPFLEGCLCVASGPSRLALSSGAPLLPVFTVREPDGEFLTTVEPPLPIGGGSAAAVEAAVAFYARRLEIHALRYPDQFFWRDPIVRQKAAARDVVIGADHQG